MTKVMKLHNGMGLAAPQVEVLARVFIANIKDKIKAFVNPIILDLSDTKTNEIERCLSIPDIAIKVARSSWILLQYHDEDFNEHQEHFYGLDARCVQHEIDHLNGVVLFDHIKSRVIRNISIEKYFKKRKV